MSTIDIAHTPEDLLTMPDGQDYELVDGQLVERKMSMVSSWIAGQMFFQLAQHVQTADLGWVFPEGTSFQCFPDDPDRVRRPDASFLRRERMPGAPPHRGHGKIAPDLAVEVVSPNDLFEEVDQKVDEWLAAGVRLVWVIVPRTRTVRIHTHEAEVRKLSEDEELTAAPILAGFRCRVADLFPPQSQTA